MERVKIVNFLYKRNNLIFLLIVLLNFQSAIAAQKRIALVIGNSDYKVAPLKNSVNDATDISKQLKKLGFEVDTLLNVTYKQMILGINRFGKSLNQNNTVGLFFFAGHGLQINNNNFLLPLGAVIEDETDVEFEAINAARVLAKMSFNESGLNIMILDACRNNPFSRSFRSASRGLTLMRPPSGSLILYATEPGKVAADGSGRNGLFTEKLLANINTKGIKVEEMFKQTTIEVSRVSNKKQIPWSEGVILGDFYFNANDSLSQDSPPKIVQDKNIPGSQENIFWNSVDKNPSLEAYSIYLQQYPDGHYKKLALIKIKQLPTTTTTTSSPNPVRVKETTKLSDKEQLNLNSQDELNLLIKKAKKSELALRLTSPKTTSAMFYYSQVLSSDPNHPQA